MSAITRFDGLIFKIDDGRQTIIHPDHLSHYFHRIRWPSVSVGRSIVFI